MNDTVTKVTEIINADTSIGQNERTALAELFRVAYGQFALNSNAPHGFGFEFTTEFRYHEDAAKDLTTGEHPA